MRTRCRPQQLEMTRPGATSTRVVAALAGVAMLGAACGTDLTGSAPVATRTVTIQHQFSADVTVQAARVSPECEEAMRQAADQAGRPTDERLLQRTLTTCESAAEWFAALRLHPGAVGHTSVESVSETDIEHACQSDRTSPICREAADLGLIQPSNG